MSWQLWFESKGEARWREVPEPHIEPGQDDEVRIRTLYSGISRGTERLVFEGRVPASVASLMTAPAQQGTFPFPVSYGYLCVGEVDEGPADLLGTTVFGLLPHHSHHVTDRDRVHPVPANVPARRALLAGAAETGLNILWQEPPRFGDRLTVVGAGMIGTATALLADRFPLNDLEVVETAAERRELLTDLGLRAVPPQAARSDRDVVVHTSATEAGLATALQIAGEDAAVVEASWYGTTAPRVPLGEDFHARRLSLVSSQVGAVAEGRRARRSTTDRLRLALQALTDERFEALLTGSTDRVDLPQVLAGVFADPGTLCHTVDYTEKCEETRCTD